MKRLVSRGFPRICAGVSVLALVLAGCAGGGGGGRVTQAPPVPNLPAPPPPPPPAPTVTAADFRTPEYNLSWALEAIHAAEAYAQGYTGSGVIVGVVDFNFDLSSSEVRYNSASRGPNAQAVAWYRAQTGSNPSADSHGQAMAVIAAGVKNNSGIHGVAFDATVLAADYFARVNETEQLVAGKRYHVSDPWTYLTQRGARIISKSFGYDSDDIISNPPPVQEYYVNESDAVAVRNGALLVSSAGNNANASGGGANPILSNLETIDELRAANLLSGPGAFIVVGAVDQSNQIAFFSNRAGTARDFFVVAPGVGITIPYNGSLGPQNGTSISAPLVAGAAAVVMQRWPSLTARQVADVLFASATDLGAPGVDAIYGRGLVNVSAAMQPIGTTTLAVQSGAPVLSASALLLGPAFGDAPALRSAVSNVMMLDGFGRDFQTDLSARVASVPQSLPIAGLLQQRRSWRGTQYGIGAGVISVGVQDSGARFTAINGLQLDEAQNSTVQFRGAAGTMSWTFGSGLTLRDALAQRGASETLSLTGAFTGALDRPGLFGGLRMELTPGTALTVALSHANENTGQQSMRKDREQSTDSVALQIDTRESAVQLSVALGAVIENGSVLGSRSTGGLAFGDGAATLWNSVGFEAALPHAWTLRSSVTLAMTDAGGLADSLIASLRPVLSSSLSLGLARRDLLLRGDALSFTLHQTLRAEQAEARLVTGDRLDSTGRVIFGATEASLVPSGRELALETGYRLSLADWRVEAALAYRFDAGHVAGREDAGAMLSVTRAF